MIYIGQISDYENVSDGHSTEWVRITIFRNFTRVNILWHLNWIQHKCGKEYNITFTVGSERNTYFFSYNVFHLMVVRIFCTMTIQVWEGGSGSKFILSKRGNFYLTSPWKWRILTRGFLFDSSSNSSWKWKILCQSFLFYLPENEEFWLGDFYLTPMKMNNSDSWILFHPPENEEFWVGDFYLTQSHKSNISFKIEHK